ncbi:UNVERIFIED_CONTAM: component of the polarisome [Siphonaria sp. JEL0065]|nr:component of the polarisome [Siphonaria sp. JEL0065]
MSNGDDLAIGQYETLANYLGFTPATLQQNANQAAIASSRQGAKDKMMRLSKQQFMDLSTDVTDEIKRRNLDQKEVPFLPLSDQFLPKRNQARQKLATLPTPKFKELSTDIFWDLERRFPIAGQIYLGMSPSAAGSRKASTAVDIGSTVEAQARSVEGISPETVERLRSEYENRIEALQSRLVQMEKETRAAKEEQQRSYDAIISDQTNKLHELENSYNKLRDEHNKLQNKYDALQDDYSNQQQIASDIRSEASNLLGEIKALTQKNEDLTHQLALKNASNSVNGSAVQDSGVLDKLRLQAYYDAVDNLLQASRSKTPTSVLVAMKSIVIACKNITEDAELFENNNNLSQESRDSLEITKNNLSQSLTELMGAAKGHATNYGSVAPEVLEGAVNALTGTVAQLVRGLKEALGGDAVGSVVGGGYEIDELKEYLEKQTDQIVQAIQSLLNSMRQNQTFGQEFTATVSQITTIVSSICQVSSATMAKPSAAAVRGRGNEILLDLKDSSSKIGELGNALVASPTSKALKQRIASSSYEIAKFVKELISLIG